MSLFPNLKGHQSRMFPFITKTWNPCVGCCHDCRYCWAKSLAETKLKHTDRYKAGFVPKMIDRELARRFKKGDFVFVCDMGDLFGLWVPRYWIWNVLKAIKKSPEAKFLLLTKNPERYLDFEWMIPENCVCAATIETNRSTAGISKAPQPGERWRGLRDLDYPHKILVAEPILEFDLTTFESWILSLRPQLDMVVLGYDNYSNKLPEPALEKTRELKKRLERKFVKVVTKTMRKAWWQL